LREHLKKFYPEAEIIENKNPICTVPKVCGVVSLELCNRLLMAEDAFVLAKNTAELHMDEDDVRQSHQRNVSLAKRGLECEGPSGKAEGVSPFCP
jgi:hypothetical protein